MTTSYAATDDPPTTRTVVMTNSLDTIEKVSIIISKGSLEGVYPGLIMANGVRAEGIEVNLFFTFFGPDAVHRARHEHIKVATVGNPGLHLATMLGGLPGMSSVMTHFLDRKMAHLKMAHLKMARVDVPPIPEFVVSASSTAWPPGGRSSSRSNVSPATARL